MTRPIKRSQQCLTLLGHRALVLRLVSSLTTYQAESTDSPETARNSQISSKVHIPNLEHQILHHLNSVHEFQDEKLVRKRPS